MEKILGLLLGTNIEAWVKPENKTETKTFWFTYTRVAEVLRVLASRGLTFNWEVFGKGNNRKESSILLFKGEWMLICMSATYKIPNEVLYYAALSEFTKEAIEGELTGVSLYPKKS